VERFEISLRHIDEATGEITAGSQYRGGVGGSAGRSVRVHDSSIGSLFFTRTIPAFLIVFFLPKVTTFMAAREFFRLMFFTASNVVIQATTKNKITAHKALVAAVLPTKLCVTFVAVGSISVSLGVASVAYTIPTIVEITAIVAKVVT
jgi:hypothetical protein